MRIIEIVIFCVGVFIVFYAMVGYPLVLILLNKLLKPSENSQIRNYEPMVTYIIVAHNEEKVIQKKLENAVSLDYPIEKIQIIIASDNSTDGTNDIVKTFVETHEKNDIFLCCTKVHKGKTNAQNEAQKYAKGDILVMTDANTLLKTNAIRELVSYFSTEDVAYVCGKLEYSNEDGNMTSDLESTYWNLDVFMRDIESRIKCITAGNGALYAVRNDMYVDVEPIYCHDSIMPYMYGKEGKRALFNPKAIAYEKAGETNIDEYNRKVRMNRDILDMLSWGLQVINVFKYGWFSFFYFGHRTCRYSIWVAHLFMIITSLLLAIDGSFIFSLLFVLQIIFFTHSYLTIKGKCVNNKYINLACYYGMTVIAQGKGVINIITGKAKPVWEKAETTR